jgi:Zn finger protein HypA/HybF involved in hydrogenase expression
MWELKLELMGVKPHWVFCEECGRDVVWDANLSQVCPKCRRATAMG